MYNGRNISKETKLNFMSCKLLVVDEISMAGHQDVRNLDKFLSQVFDETRISFGGTNLVLAGDHSQLAPVLKRALYREPKSSNNRQHTRGHQLYRSIKNTVCLARVMRSKNTDYIKLQEEVRNGDWTDQLREDINSRFEAQLEPVDMTDPAVIANREADYCPTVVVHNETRQALYNAHMTIISDTLVQNGGERPILLRAEIQSAHPIKTDDCSVLAKRKKRTISKSSRPAPLTQMEEIYLNTLPDSDFDRTPLGLFLYYGAYVLITQNLGVRYGIANGTRGKVVGWQFPQGTEFINTTYHGVHARLPVRNGQIVRVECVHVQVTNVTLKQRAPHQPTGLPPNVISLPCIKLTTQTAIPLPTGISNRQNVGLRIIQVPLRQAIVLTTYSVQGGQFLRYTIAESTPKAFYVQFSRGTQGLASLSLRRFITPSFSKAARPNEDLITELKRLQRLHDETKIRFVEKTVPGSKDSLIANDQHADPPQKRMRL